MPNRIRGLRNASLDVFLVCVHFIKRHKLNNVVSIAGSLRLGSVKDEIGSSKAVQLELNPTGGWQARSAFIKADRQPQQWPLNVVPCAIVPSENNMVLYHLRPPLGYFLFDCVSIYVKATAIALLLMSASARGMKTNLWCGYREP